MGDNYSYLFSAARQRTEDSKQTAYLVTPPHRRKTSTSFLFFFLPPSSTTLPTLSSFFSYAQSCSGAQKETCSSGFQHLYISPVPLPSPSFPTPPPSLVLCSDRFLHVAMAQPSHDQIHSMQMTAATGRAAGCRQGGTSVRGHVQPPQDFPAPRIGCHGTGATLALGYSGPLAEGAVTKVNTMTKLKFPRC